MTSGKNKRRIILATVVALFATLVSYSAFSSMRSELNEQKKIIESMKNNEVKQKPIVYSYVIAIKDLKTGDTISDSDVKVEDFETQDISAFMKRSDVVNKVLLKDIKIGEKITSSHIAKVSEENVTLSEGCRALTLPSDNFQGISKNMTKGSLVDIYSSAKDSNWFLEGIKILGFDSAKNNSAKNDLNITNSSSITFEIPVDDVSDIISNISKNKLVLVTRSDKEKTVRRIVKTSTNQKQKTNAKNYNSDKELERLKSLPKLPDTIPAIGPQFSDNLPAPVQPAAVAGPAVEVIEANVRSKVTFD